MDGSPLLPLYFLFLFIFLFARLLFRHHVHVSNVAMLPELFSPMSVNRGGLDAWAFFPRYRLSLFWKKNGGLDWTG